MSINGYTRQYVQSQSERIEQAVQDRVLTAKGERPMMPLYGTDIAGAEGKPPSPELTANIIADLSEALAPETDFNLVNIVVVLSPEQRSVEIMIHGDELSLSL